MGARGKGLGKSISPAVVYSRPMALSPVRWAIIAVLIVVGVYMTVFHQSHEDVGIGDNHPAHTVIRIVLLAAAGYVWWTGRGKAAAAPTQ
jgi:glucose uptake protein GlcU